MRKKTNHLAGHGDCNRLPPLWGKAGLGVATVDDFTRAVFTLAALGSHTQFKLNIVKTHAFTGVQGDLFFGHAAADANNHGKSGRVVVMH